MVISTSYARGVFLLRFLSLILLSASVILIGLSTGYFNDIFHFRTDSTINAPPVVNYSYTTRTGFFRHCNDYSGTPVFILQGETMKCSSIDENCRYLYRSVNDNTALNQQLTMPKCTQFNALRGLLLISAGLSCISLLILLFTTICFRSAISANYVVIVLSTIAAISGAVSMSLLLDYKINQYDNNSARNSANNISSYNYVYGTSFIFQVVAWPLALGAALVMLIAQRACCKGCLAEEPDADF